VIFGSTSPSIVNAFHTCIGLPLGSFVLSNSFLSVSSRMLLAASHVLFTAENPDHLTR
jgi:hypothetical protein